MYIDHMCDRLCKKGVVMDVDDGGVFDGHKVALRLMQAEAAAVQSNFSLALQLLKTTRDVSICHVFVFTVLARYYRKSSVRPSVRLSVCPSVTLRYAEHIGWTSLKLITRIISLGSSLLGATTSAV